MAASPGQVPRALTHAYEKLIEVLRANRVNPLADEADSPMATFLEEMSASTRSAFDHIETPGDVCVAVDRFVYRFCLREDWNAEFVRRAEYVMSQCGAGRDYDQAKKEAIAAVLANWSKSQAQEGLKRLCKYDPPGTAGDLSVEAWLPKRFLDGDQSFGPIDVTAHPALKKWRDECQRILLEADCLEATGCWNMHHIYLASRPNPPDPPESLRELLGACEFPMPVPDLGLLDSIESAASSLMDWAVEHVALAPDGTGGDDEELEDGPVSGNRFRHGGKTVNLPPNQWHILKSMWGHEDRNMHDVIDDVWTNRGLNAPERIMPELSRLNRSLAKAKYPRKITKPRNSDSLLWQPAQLRN